MPTQTAERQELYKVIDALPDDSVSAVLGLVRSLRLNAEMQDDDLSHHIPNAETAAAIEECRSRRGKRASSIGDFFEAMHNAVDSDA